MSAATSPDGQEPNEEAQAREEYREHSEAADLEVADGDYGSAEDALLGALSAVRRAKHVTSRGDGDE